METGTKIGGFWITQEERVILSHALREAIERVSSAGGNQYGPISLAEAKILLSRIEKEKHPLALYLEGRCPECGEEIVSEAVAYCPLCLNELNGDIVLRQFVK